MKFLFASPKDLVSHTDEFRVVESTGGAQPHISISGRAGPLIML